MKKSYFALLAVLLLAACVNVHVHFPPAPESSAAAPGTASLPADKSP